MKINVQKWLSKIVTESINIMKLTEARKILMCINIKEESGIIAPVLKYFKAESNIKLLNDSQNALTTKGRSNNNINDRIPNNIL